MGIKETRRKLGWTAEELAYKLGVSVGTVSRWETGKCKPSRLARARLKEVVDKQQDEDIDT
jgi:DNA-binding transcriptional regulator YiaG